MCQTTIIDIFDETGREILPEKYCANQQHDAECGDISFRPEWTVRLKKII